MKDSPIFAPLLAQMLLTMLVWIYLFAKRIPFILNSKLTPAQLTPLEFVKLMPPEVANPSDNFKNLCELPVLFYALVLFLFTTERVDTVYVVAAWAFVGFRVLHSVMHCTINIVNIRFAFYLLASLALWFMLLRSAWQVFLG